ncbi:MAG: hypothetical protein ACLFSB_16295 [Chitinispirillaceae bacterium]
MKIVALIDHDKQPDVVEGILKHCKLWKEPMQRGQPAGAAGDSQTQEMTCDSGYFDKSCA